MESPQDFSAHRYAPGRRLSRRSLLGWSAATTFAAAAGLFAARTAYDENARGRVLFEDVFAGNSLSRNHWNPYICDNNSHGWPWLMQPSVAVASSAIGKRNGYNAAYDLPSAIRVDDGLTLTAYRGTRAPDIPGPARSSARIPAATTSGRVPCIQLGSPSGTPA